MYLSLMEHPRYNSEYRAESQMTITNAPLQADQLLLEQADDRDKKRLEKTQLERRYAHDEMPVTSVPG